MSENLFDAPQESTAVLSETTRCVPWWRLALIQSASIIVVLLCLINILSEFS